MSKFIELNSGKDKFIVNVNSISYVERSDLSGSVVHFAYSRSDAAICLLFKEKLQVTENSLFYLFLLPENGDSYDIKGCYLFCNVHFFFKGFPDSYFT